jgi:Fe-S oxidoreductase
LRDYLFGYFHITARLLAAFAPLTNWFLSVPVFKNLIAHIFKITPHRPFPKFSWTRAKVRTTETRRYGEKTNLDTDNTDFTEKPKRKSVLSAKSVSRNVTIPVKPKVIFLSDAFSRYMEPQVEQAAFDILAKCGYHVLVLSISGAGAALISKSFFESAQRHARGVLDALNQLDPERVLPIVGIEPPEVYCLKNEYADLLPSRAEEIASRSARTWLLDEFLIRSDAFNKLRVANNIQLPLQHNLPKIKLQPHCHQRAEAPASDGLPVGAAATLSLLQSLGLDAEMLDAGCCGMAGTFGYEAEHYELSMKVGERLLNSEFKIQKSEVVCSGAACRMQVTQVAGTGARHPLEVAAEWLKVQG